MHHPIHSYKFSFAAAFPESAGKALSVISPAQRMAFNLLCVEELPIAEAAGKMNCSESAVRVALCKARKKMRLYLENKSTL